MAEYDKPEIIKTTCAQVSLPVATFGAGATTRDRVHEQPVARIWCALTAFCRGLGEGYKDARVQPSPGTAPKAEALHVAVLEAAAYAGGASIGSTIEGSSFSGLLTRVDIGPHAHRLGPERPHQVTRIRLVDKSPATVGGREDERHAIVDFSHHFVERRDDDGEGANPLARRRVVPVFP